MNLIICTTPLQVLIAERIVEQYPQDEFISVMLVLNSNDKQKNYYENLKKVSKKSYFFDLSRYKNKFLHLFFFLYCRYVLFFRQEFSKVFLASIDSILVQAILSSQNKEKVRIFTFDEGTANIYKKSMFYINPQSGKGKFIYQFLGNKYSLEKIKKSVLLHYTIYAGFENIVKNTKYLSLFNFYRQEGLSDDNEKVLSIFLGQPIFDDDRLNIEYISNAVEKLDIDLYFPHPREKFKIRNVKYVETNLIFEEYFINHMLLSSKPVKYKIYTFFSSSLLNLVSLQTYIELTAVKFDWIPEKFEGIYSLFSQSGINILNIQDDEVL